MLRRIAVAVCATACLALPATSRADTPGFTLIGPPATLNTIVFASDGTVYGTPDAQNSSHHINPPAALWRSTDHGRTWSAVYRPPSGSTVVALAASSSAAYVLGGLPGQSEHVERIDIATGKVVPLALQQPIAIDAAGTAYSASGDLSPTLTRCPATADTCDVLPMPAGQQARLTVDPLSAGVMATATSSAAGGAVYRSTDGGATWTRGGHVDCAAHCPMGFAGPAAQTLYVEDVYDFKVSHDAGLTFTSHAQQTVGGSGVIVGSQPASLLSFTSSGGGRFARALDEGASFQAVALPGGFAVMDPSDANHFFFQSDEGEVQTSDSGLSYTNVASRQFGITDLASAIMAGSGREIYAGATGSAIWHSDDLGATWTRTPTPVGGGDIPILVSRDDPRVAYTAGNAAPAMRTADGGAHWDLMPQSRAIVGIEPGDPRHLFASGSDGISESLDGGGTWSAAPPSSGCTLVAGSDGRVGCAGGAALAPLTSAPPPFALGLYGSPDEPGAYAVASAGLLGDVSGDWNLSASLAPTGAFGPAPGRFTAGLAAWPTRAGTTFYGYDGALDTTWVRRGSGRWWRFQVAGNPLFLLEPLDATHALGWEMHTTANPNVPEALAVIDLTHPAVSAPTVHLGPTGLTCVVPWSPSDAETSSYAWLRDGTVVRGADASLFPLRPADRGHELTCRATARTDFGTTALVSGNSYDDPGLRLAANVRLTGSARFGTLLRCSAATPVTWLRNGRSVVRRHARTYLVGPADEGHVLACRGAAPNGTIARSPALHVPKAHGGRAVAVTP